MPLKLTCPHCGTQHRFGSPYPAPGAEVHCGCGRVLVVSFPPDLMSTLQAHGVRLADPAPPVDATGASYRPAPTAALPPRTAAALDDPESASARAAAPRPPEGHR